MNRKNPFHIYPGPYKNSFDIIWSQKGNVHKLQNKNLKYQVRWPTIATWTYVASRIADKVVTSYLS